jgi:glucose-1-phosphate adenylyltransferase
MVTDASGRITQFQEKPKSNPLSNKASLGIYVFDRDCLLQALLDDAADRNSSHDFGGDIIPRMIATEPVYHFDFEGYWRDVGTIPSYMETSMEVLDPASGLDLRAWGVRTNHQEIPLVHQHALHAGSGAKIDRSLVSRGCFVDGEVSDSILSPGVKVGRGARVTRSILLHDVTIGEHSILDNVIVDKHGVIGSNVHLGDDALGDRPNEHKPHLLSCGTTVIGKGARIADGVHMGRNALVFPYVSVNPLAPFPAGTAFLDPE